MAERRSTPETLRDQARETLDEELVEDLEAPADSADRVAGGQRGSRRRRRQETVSRLL
jgi:hypothetical protein